MPASFQTSAGQVILQTYDSLQMCPFGVTWSLTQSVTQVPLWADDQFHMLEMQTASTACGSTHSRGGSNVGSGVPVAGSLGTRLSGGSGASWSGLDARWVHVHVRQPDCVLKSLIVGGR